MCLVERQPTNLTGLSRISRSPREFFKGVLLTTAQTLRDEVHRFAQHYHHILRRKRVLEE